MWFLFFEIFFLVGISFLLGAGATTLALRVLLPADENRPRPSDATSEVTS